MHRENMKSFAIAMATALGFLLAIVPVASAQNVFQCTGVIADGRTINSNLVVPVGCELVNVTVVGNVLVGTGANLLVLAVTAQKVTLDGNVTANGCGSVFLENQPGGMVSVAGNVQIQNCGFLPTGQSDGYRGYDVRGTDVTIGGNFVCNNNGRLFAWLRKARFKAI